MTRKRSPETELRHVRRELNETKAKLKSLREELSRRVQVGQMMANICFNLAQHEKYDAQHRQSMRDCQQLWDSIKGAK